jgi:hypothetical protein
MQGTFMNRSDVSTSIIICAFVFTLLCTSVPVYAAADDAIRNALPPSECPKGWVMEDQVKYYTPDTLFEHINGEAELFFPYGFEALATAIYTNRANPQLAILADVYRMTSPLNAFGIYSNYRRPRSESAAIGAEGFASPSQLMFYQDNYFVRLQASGTSELDKDVILACGRAVSQNLPAGAGHPKELELIGIPGVVPGSERYIAQSLLGYAFFRRGVIADAALEGERVQVFVVPEDSRDAARKAFDQYRSYLISSGKNMDVAEAPERISLTAVDPLYGGAFVEQSGRYIIGVVRMKEPAAATRLIEQLHERLLKIP